MAVCLMLGAVSHQAKAQDRFADSISVVVDTTVLHKEMVDKWSTWRPDPESLILSVHFDAVVQKTA